MALRKIKKASAIFNHLLSAGIETVSQYKKALIIMYDYQFEHQAILWASPKKTKELLDLIKKYNHDLVYDQV
ncbi:hypothetical protein HMPREF1544_00196 [Mucor circinelloides 1006PhL]|uniref:Uncharacterized protein n=1 Tax=Mucor circinelloides f. circinelloides (strain 1006PhL) TaxID=1220926 RepID=S2JXA8_MUCC1|nr:hypothetical protein HMPREF1544_00196 [Mucor circinelloides 1006PhL]